MGDNSNIEWTDATWNPIVGCRIVSPGCTNCYAMRFAGNRLDGNPKSPHYAGTTQKSKAGPVWSGMLSLAPEHILTAPLRWKKRRTIFVNSMGDLFHCPHEWIDQVFAVMALAPQHTFQVLTKRAERMRGYMNHPRRRFIVEKTARILHNQGGTLPQHAIAYFTSCPAPLPHVWLGVSVEDQKRADERIPDLLHTPAAVRFISAEPLLGSIDLQGAVPALDWVIVGGESGPGARPMHPDWARSIRDQCGAAGVPFFFKQWGEHAPNGSGRYSMIKVGKRRAGRILDGREHNAMPEVRLLVPPRPALPR